MNEAVFAPAPALSVIIPAYNASETIAKTLLSILDQTADADCYEIIVVDDGSNDDTLAVCTEFAQKHSNIHVIHQPNGGVSAARNRGLSLARGHWVSFVDSDDYVLPSYAEVMTTLCLEQELVIFDNLLERGDEWGREKAWIAPCFDRVMAAGDVLMWICENRLNSPWDKRFSLEVLRRNHIRFEAGVNMAEDLLFNFQYALCVDSAFVSGQAVYVHVDNLVGLCHQRVTECRLREYETVYHKMHQGCTSGGLGEKHRSAINAAFLRMVARYAGQMSASGFSGRDITGLLNGSQMVQQVLAAPGVSWKDHVRKFLLRARLYKICAVVLKYR